MTKRNHDEITQETIRYVDLCCGIGGFRVGINQFKSQFNFECVLSADIKPDAIRTYNANFNEEMTPPTCVP